MIKVNEYYSLFIFGEIGFIDGFDCKLLLINESLNIEDFGRASFSNDILRFIEICDFVKGHFVDDE